MPAARALSVTLLVRDECSDIGPLRAALDAARVAYDVLSLGEGPCGFATPSVRVSGVYGGAQTAVRPDPVGVTAWLERLGVEVG